MEKEQEKCELCELINAFNADAARERKLYNEQFGEDRQIGGLIEVKSKCIARARNNKRVTIGVLYKDDFDDVRFKFFDCHDICNRFTRTISYYIQYCPFCGRKIKQ